MITIHTSRTIMFSELSQVMNYGIEGADFNETLNLNVTHKLSSRNLLKTNRYLKQLYRFDNNDILFRAFKFYWPLVDHAKKGIITLLFAITNDFLLSESIDLVIHTPIGTKVAIEKFTENIEQYHPGKYSAITIHSASKNLASSWKQAGYIEGKYKNLRVQAGQDYYTASFALLLAYLNGDRGDFLLTSKWAKALAISQDQLRELLKEAAKRDLLQYQSSGKVTSISYEKQINMVEYGKLY